MTGPPAALWLLSTVFAVAGPGAVLALPGPAGSARPEDRVSPVFVSGDPDRNAVRLPRLTDKEG
jgi:hypothetical protein